MRDDSSDSSTKKKIVLKGLPLDQIWINTFVIEISSIARNYAETRRVDLERQKGENNGTSN